MDEMKVQHQQEMSKLQEECRREYNEMSLSLRSELDRYQKEL